MDQLETAVAAAKPVAESPIRAIRLLEAQGRPELAQQLRADLAAKAARARDRLSAATAMDQACAELAQTNSRSRFSAALSPVWPGEPAPGMAALEGEVAQLERMCSSAISQIKTSMERLRESRRARAAQIGQAHGAVQGAGQQAGLVRANFEMMQRRQYASLAAGSPPSAGALEAQLEERRGSGVTERLWEQAEVSGRGERELKEELRRVDELLRRVAPAARARLDREATAR